MSLHVLSMFSGNLLSSGDFGLDLLDLLFGFLDVVTLENFVGKSGEFLLGLVCNSIDLTLDRVLLLIGPVLHIVDLVVDLSLSLVLQYITLLLDNIDKSSSLSGQLFSKILSCMFSPV